MGILLSRWRKKASTIEVLEGLDKEIASYEKLRRQNLQQQKDIIGRLVVWSIALYVVLAVIFYLCYSPVTKLDKVLFSLPYIGFPLIVWLLKRLLHWYFVNRLSKNESKLATLRNKKIETLEEVMEKETYKKAKEILEKFDSERFKQIEKSTAKTIRERSTSANPELRPRMVVSPMGSTSPPHGPGTSPPRPGMPSPPRPGMPSPVPYGPPGVGGPLLPRPIPPRRRSVVDKLVDFLVGDGPPNRYALVCRHCHSHNGMALKEEFEFIAFRCCYCYAPNPARKLRPVAPRLPVPVPTNIPEPTTSSAQGSDEGGDTDEDNDVSDSTPDVDQSPSVNGKVKCAMESNSQISNDAIITEECSSSEPDKKND